MLRGWGGQPCFVRDEIMDCEVCPEVKDLNVAHIWRSGDILSFLLSSTVYLGAVSRCSVRRYMCHPACRFVRSQGSLNFHSHTVLALHFLLASGYVPSVLPVRRRKGGSTRPVVANKALVRLMYLKVASFCRLKSVCFRYGRTYS